jgi:hypothetical protein
MRMTRNRCLDVLRKKGILFFDTEEDNGSAHITPDIHSQIELRETTGKIKVLIRGFNCIRPLMQFFFSKFKIVIYLKQNSFVKI